MAKPFELTSIDTTTIYQRIITANVGEQISYDELTALIGRNVQGPARSNLQAARMRALRDNNMVFSVVRTEGMKRLSDPEVVNTGEHVMGKIRRASRRGLKILTQGVADFNRLPNESKIKFNTFASVMGAITHATMGGTIQKLEKRVAEVHDKLPLAKTLAAFQE
jgi:hypothetical protein